jgi:short-subunit dehydrogenase
MQTKRDLTGKIIILTGASAGIGEATARELAAAGATLVLAARREGRLNKLAEEIKSEASGVLVVRTDLNEQGDIQRLVWKTLSAFGRVDVLLNIAGWGAYGWIEDSKPDHLQKQFAVNVLAQLYLIRLVVPVMKDHGGGHIINISSYASRIAVPPQTIYAGTKYAIEGLSDGLRRELLPWNVKVSRVHPSGVTGTEFNEKAAKRGGVGFKSPGIGNISKEYVARKLHRLILHPKPQLKLGRLYDFAEVLNKLAPWVIDLFMKIWVSRKRNM